MAELIGATLGDGRYRIDSRLGGGGQGAVYKGTHLTLSVPVAIKVLRAASARDRAMRTRFTREAQRAATLRHSNIVRVLDYAYDTAREIYYIVSEFVEGTDLKRLLEDKPGPMPVDQVLGYARQLGAALQFAHGQNIIHRDIKPSNILLEERTGRAVLGDFGLARMAIGEKLNATAQGLDTPGTPAYMSPEQYRGTAVDSRSDLYSLGVVLYEMLTGRNPFVGASDTPDSMRYKHIHEPPPPARSLNPSLSPQMEAVLARALAKERGDRFQTATELVSALERASRRKRQARARRPRRGAFPAWIPLLVAGVGIVLVFALVPGARSYVESLWGGPATEETSASPTSDLGGPEATSVAVATRARTDARQTEAAIATRTAQADLVATESAARSATEAAQASAATRQVRRPTATVIPTNTRPQTTVEAVPVETETPTETIAIVIEGLDEWGLRCSTLVLFSGDAEVRRIPLEGVPGGRLQIERGSADWLRFEGSPDGKCPWKKWTLSQLDPKHIDLAGSEVCLTFTE